MASSFSKTRRPTPSFESREGRSRRHPGGASRSIFLSIAESPTDLDTSVADETLVAARLIRRFRDATAGFARSRGGTKPFAETRSPRRPTSLAVRGTWASPSVKHHKLSPTTTRSSRSPSSGARSARGWESCFARLRSEAAQRKLEAGSRSSHGAGGGRFSGGFGDPAHRRPLRGLGQRVGICTPR